MLLVWACGTGILAGLTCSVFVLLPLSLLAIALTVAAGWISGLGGHFLDIATSVIACQAGYMLGLTGRDALAQVVARIGIAPSNHV